jgi:hypothetical protein
MVVSCSSCCWQEQVLMPGGQLLDQFDVLILAVQDTREVSTTEPCGQLLKHLCCLLLLLLGALRSVLLRDVADGAAEELHQLSGVLLLVLLGTMQLLW